MGFGCQAIAAGAFLCLLPNIYMNGVLEVVSLTISSLPPG